MRLDTRAFALAAGAAAAILFTLCALAVAIAPDPTTAFFGYLVHMDLSGSARTLTFGSFVGGLLAWTVGTAFAFGLAATIYNRLIRPASAAQTTAPRAATQHA